MTKPVRFLIPIVIAMVLGPLIAGLAVCLLAVGTNIFDHTGTLPIADLFPMFGFYIVFAYLNGGVIALLAGILVSIWMIWRSPSAIVAIAAAMIATVGYLGVSALGFLGLAEWSNARSNFLFTLVLAVIAADGCWLLTRPFMKASERIAHRRLPENKI
jgi:hypothetical protein